MQAAEAEPFIAFIDISLLLQTGLLRNQHVQCSRAFLIHRTNLYLPVPSPNLLLSI